MSFKKIFFFKYVITGIASEKIRAKVVKEGNEVTLTRVMEIASLETPHNTILIECKRLPR